MNEIVNGKIDVNGEMKLHKLDRNAREKENEKQH